MWIWLGLVVFLVGSYFAQKFAPPPKPRIVGIDLGTTYSCVAVYHAGSGEIEVIEDSEGNPTTPSVVYFDSGRKRVVVGYEAKALMNTHPDHVIYEAKRFIGRPYLQSSEDDERFPFTIVNHGGSFGFDIPGIGVKTPQEVGALVISKLRSQTEKALNTEIKQVVISVPAEFNAQQRQATIEAANLAGMSVLRILSEPTAAALAYGLHDKSDVGLIIVFDFGGGTLDVSVLSVENGMFSTLAIAGNKQLGGEDLSHALFQHVLPLIQSEVNRDLTPVEKQILRQKVETLKLDLSLAMSSSLSIFIDGRTVSQTVTRDLFEEITAPVFVKMLRPVEEALKASHLRVEEIDEVVLVGGSTRIPKVRQVLEDLFGKPPNFSINPDEAVARGVAMQAGILAGAWPLQVSAIEVQFQDMVIDLTDE